MTITLEICVDTPRGLADAIEGGAGRIELCSSLDLGGLTPSPGLIALAARTPVPVYMMIRPRAGSFCYTPAEEQAMIADIDAARQAGLAGIVIGAAHQDSSLDTAMLERLINGPVVLASPCTVFLTWCPSRSLLCSRPLAWALGAS